MEITPPVNTTQVSLNLDTQAQAQSAQQQAARLPMSTVLLGVVAGNDKNGNLIIKLAGNDLILSSPLALSKSAQVALKLENVSGTITAQLLSVDGKLPATQAQAVSNQLQQNPNQQGAQGQLSPQNQTNFVQLKLLSIMSAGLAKPVPQPQAQTVQAPVVPKTDMVTLSSPQTTALRATVIHATPEIGQILRNSISLASPLSGSEIKRLAIPDEIKAGSQLSLKVLSQTPPNNPQQQIQTDNRSLGKQDWMSQGDPQQGDGETDIAAQLKTPLPNQQTQPQGQPPTVQDNKLLPQLLKEFIPTSKPLPNGNMQLNGLVLDVKPNGEMLVETKIGKVIVEGGQQFSNIAKGTVITFEMTQIAAAKAGIALPQGDTTIEQLAKDWPALKAMLQHAPEVGQNTSQIQTKLAAVDTLFAARLAGFINAIKSDNIRDWLGANTYDAMSSDYDGSELLGKVKSDFGTIREMFNQPNSANWQTMLFPLFDGRELQQARLHVKYLPDENQKPDPEAGTRFIVELNTSYFGEMQFDGLVHNTKPSKHFDLMLRSHVALDEEMQIEIREIFNAASEVTGFRGSIEFATMREFPVKVFEEIIDKNRNSSGQHLRGIEA